MIHKLPKELQMTRRQLAIDGFVKVGIPGDCNSGVVTEWCWAKRLSKSYARLITCCMSQNGVGYGDVVEFREWPKQSHPLSKQFLWVVSRGSEQVMIAYASRSDAASASQKAQKRLKSRCRDVQRFLETARGEGLVLAWECMHAGFLCIALPVGTTDDEADRLLGDCPHLVEVGEMCRAWFPGS